MRSLAKTMADNRVEEFTPVEIYLNKLTNVKEELMGAIALVDEDEREEYLTQARDVTAQFYNDYFVNKYAQGTFRKVVDEEEASEEDVPQMTEAERKHKAAATQIALLHGKQCTLLSKKLYAYVTDIEQANKQIETIKKNTEFDDDSKQAVIGVKETRIQECNVNIEALRDEFCYLEQLICLQEKDLDVTLGDVPQDCRDATPIDFKTGNPLEMSQTEQDFKIESYLKDWTDYYKDVYTKPNEDGDDVVETPARRAKRKPENVTTGPPTKKGKKGKSMFEKDERVEVESSDFDKPIKWWKATIVTTSCPGKISHYKVLYDTPTTHHPPPNMHPIYNTFLVRGGWWVVGVVFWDLFIK